MRWKQNLTFNNDDENYVQIFTKKPKKLLTNPPLTTACLSVPTTLSDIEIN